MTLLFLFSMWRFVYSILCSLRSVFFMCVHVYIIHFQRWVTILITYTSIILFISHSFHFHHFRHHGETPAVCRCLSQLLWISSGGQYVALSSASLHCLFGGHQHPPALLRPPVSPPRQPEHCAGGETQRHGDPFDTCFVFLYFLFLMYCFTVDPGKTHSALRHS